MARRPLIGVTKPSHGDLVSFWCACVSLWLSGARIVAITGAAPQTALDLDGLVLTGGADVHPTLFGTPPKSGYAYDVAREAAELDWVRRAWEMDLPTLGICRGAQLINVAAGGGLHMDVAAAFRETRYPSHWLEQIHFRKRIHIEPGSRLAGVVGPAPLGVNSIHRQAIDDLGGGLQVSAHEANGAIQAIEDPGRRFWLGVQFHPEFLFYRSRFRALFKAFVAAAAAVRTESAVGAISA